MVLMECRGIDSPDVPAAKRLSQQTCWTAAPGERVLTAQSGNPMWSLDADNAADGICTKRDCNVPAPVPSNCIGDTTPYPTFWLPFDAADGIDYPVGPAGCDGAPPEMVTTGEDPSIIPSDTTYAETALNGTGSAKFTIMTSATNASLGCSQTVACSLVIIPIEGINCNANPQVGTPSYECESARNLPTGEPQHRELTRTRLRRLSPAPTGGARATGTAGSPYRSVSPPRRTRAPTTHKLR